MKTFLEWLSDVAALGLFLLTFLVLMALGPALVLLVMVLYLHLLEWLEWLENW